MKKCLHFLIYVAMSQAYVTRERRDTHDSQHFESRERVDDQDLPAPRLLRLTLVDDPSLAFKVEWNKVDVPVGADPILGYKLKVWEQHKTHRHQTVNSSDSEPLPPHKPRDVYVNGPDKTVAIVKGIEHGVTYQVRVQAYNRNGNGPLSDSVTIKVAHKEDPGRSKYVYSN